MSRDGAHVMSQQDTPLFRSPLEHMRIIGALEADVLHPHDVEIGFSS
jgi:hypothetical protein